MFHSSVVHMNPVFLKLHNRIALTFVVIFSGLFFIGNTDAVGQTSNVISAVHAESSGMTNNIRIQTSSEPAYTVYELFNPARIVVDIANTNVVEGNSFKLPGSLPITLATTTVSDTNPSLTRLEFTFSNDYATYEVKTVSNDILLTVAMNGASENVEMQQDVSSSSINTLISKKQDIESQLPSPTLAADGSLTIDNSGSENTVGDSMRNSFSSGGYDKTRISVDFY